MNDNYLAHYGIPRRSGRYPWGSGKRPRQSLERISRIKNSVKVRSSKESKITTTRSRKDDAKYQNYLKTRQLIEKGKIVIDKTLETTGSALISEHDKEWSEIERRYVNGADTWVIPSYLISAYESAGLGNPYPKEDEGYRHVSDGISSRSLESINPGYGKPGTTENCTKCTVALELQKRGYNVAAGRQTYPALADAATYWFDNATRDDYSYNDAETKIKDFGAGASGMFDFRYPGTNAGHAMYFEVNQDNSVSFLDGQNGKSYGSLEEVQKTYGFDTERELAVTRLDTCTPNWDHMAEDSVIRPARTFSNMFNYEEKHKVVNRKTGKLVDTW